MGKLYLVHTRRMDFIVSIIQYDIAKETKKRFYIKNGEILAGTSRPYVSFFDKDHDMIFRDLGEALLHFNDEITNARKRLGRREAKLYTAQEKAKSLC